MEFIDLPKVHLGFFPTPLQRLSRLGAAIGHHGLYIKRDDLTGLSLGGNKVRSLEYLLGDALRGGADTVVTAGGLQSNLCSLTAAACARVGLRCTIVHNDRRPAELTGNMLLSHLFGATPIFIGKVTEEERAVAVNEITARILAEGGHPYAIHNGASTPTGALGYVNAARELALQARELDTPLKHVVIVGAMGGTASGFVFGNALLGRPFHVHVVSVEYPTQELHDKMAALMSGIGDLIGAKAPTDPWEAATIHDDYLGGGYGIATQASAEASRLFAGTEGILLDNVYTAKTASGLIGLVREGVIPEKDGACVIHTGGMASLFA